MKEDLSQLLDAVRSYSGIEHKRDIQRVAQALQNAWPAPAANGDDCALIPVADGFNLLAMEGFMNEFVAAEPWFAGWCGVMVNLSDIAAMGGRPQAIVNALWSANDRSAELLLQGMAAASQAYQVPIVGGHTNLRSNQQQLAVAVLGHAKKPLSSFAAREGLTLMVAINLQGRWHPPGLNWDAATGAEPANLRKALALLPHLAERELVIAAKDISQAGLAGTLVMLLESCQLGAEIDLNAIPKPVECCWQQWLCAFPSFGYLLAVEPDHVAAVSRTFTDCGISAASLGTLTHSQQLWFRQGDQRACFWDLHQQPLTGMTGHPL